MSVKSMTVSGELLAYLSSKTTPEDPYLKELNAAAEIAGMPPIGIAPEQGSFIQILLKLVSAKKVIEVGTLGGYSAITMARGLPGDGTVETIEVDKGHADFARKWIENSEVSERIRVLEGDATMLLPGLEAGSYDAAFIDADKANYGVYLGQCLRLVRPGGLIMVDNAFAFGQLLEEGNATDDVWAIRKFNDLMAAQDCLQSIIVATGDGLWVGVKTA